MEDIDALESLRHQIDNCDKEIMMLLKRRFQTAKKIAEVKQRLDMEIFQPEREEKVIKYRVSVGKEYLFSENFTKKLFQVIMDESKREQEKLIEKQSKSKEKKK